MTTPELLDPTPEAPRPGWRADPRLRGIASVRRHIARGVLTNSAFQLLLVGLSTVRGFGVAAFMTRSDYGVWGLLGLVLWSAAGLKAQFGVGDKYLQQNEDDQEAAFQLAFTMDLIFMAVMLPVGGGIVFLFAAVTGKALLILPGLLLLLLLPASVLQFPIATFYRQLDYRRQRMLQAVEPVVATAVTVALAVAGAGYWSFVAGALAGAWSAVPFALRASRYRLRVRYRRHALAQYVGFSTPLLITGLSVLAMFYVINLLGVGPLGLAGIGTFTLVGNLVQFTDQADDIVTATLYPAVCAVRSQARLVTEIFVKSNRLSLIWAVPFGVGMCLFASDLTRFVLGSRWLPATTLLQIMGIVTAVHHVGYNWSAFVKSRGTTWPIAVVAVAVTSVIIAAAIPLMYSDHLVGLGIAFVIGEAVGLVLRGYFIWRFFEGFRILTQLVRAFAPSVIAVAGVLACRVTLGSEHDLASAIAVLCLYLGLTVAATVAFERPLLTEAIGYLVGRPAVASETLVAS